MKNKKDVTLSECWEGFTEACESDEFVNPVAFFFLLFLLLFATAIWLFNKIIEIIFKLWKITLPIFIVICSIFCINVIHELYKKNLTEKLFQEKYIGNQWFIKEFNPENYGTNLLYLSSQDFSQFLWDDSLNIGIYKVYQKKSNEEYYNLEIKAVSKYIYWFSFIENNGNNIEDIEDKLQTDGYIKFTNSKYGNPYRNFYKNGKIVIEISYSGNHIKYDIYNWDLFLSIEGNPEKDYIYNEKLHKNEELISDISQWVWRQENKTLQLSGIYIINGQKIDKLKYNNGIIYAKCNNKNYNLMECDCEETQKIYNEIVEKKNIYYATHYTGNKKLNEYAYFKSEYPDEF